MSRIRAPKSASNFNTSLRVEGLLYHLNGDNYVIHPIPHMQTSDVINAVCCCEKNLHFINTREMGTRLAYNNPCACCDVYRAGTTVGLGISYFEWKYKYEGRGFCSNGIGFALCPWLCCNGRIKEAAILNLNEQEEDEKKRGIPTEVFTLQRSLFTCWPCFSVMAFCPCAVPCRDFASCCAFSNGDFFMDLKTPVYGPFIAIDQPTEPIGYVVQTLVNAPSVEGFGVCTTCCFARKISTLSTRYIPTEGNFVTRDDAIGVGLLLMLFRENALLDMIMGKPTIPQARGCSCLDMGLDAVVEYKDMAGAVADGSLSLR